MFGHGGCPKYNLNHPSRENIAFMKKHYLVSLCACVGLFCASAMGQISVIGDTCPAYDGTSNPWIVGNSLIVADAGATTVAAFGNGQIFAEGGFFGRNSNTANLFLVNPQAKFEFLEQVRIGEGGTAILDIQDSAQFVANDFVYLGHFANGDGTVLISDANWESYKVVIGRMGVGRFEATNGSQVEWNGNSSSIGFDKGSVGSALISDSNLTINGSLIIGGQGDAVMEGVQFHPESFMTTEGPILLANFLGLPRPKVEALI